MERWDVPDARGNSCGSRSKVRDGNRGLDCPGNLGRNLHDMVLRYAPVDPNPPDPRWSGAFGS
jgi:hypothetical protein